MITKLQRILRKAVKDYEIKASIGEETLIAFLSVDIIRELAAPDPAAAPQPKTRKNKEEVAK